MAKDAAFSRQRSRVRIPPWTPWGHRQDGLSRLSFKEEIVGSNLTGPTRFSGFKLRWRSTRLLTGRTGFDSLEAHQSFPASSRVERTAVNRLIEVRVLGWEPFLSASGGRRLKPPYKRSPRTGAWILDRHQGRGPVSCRGYRLVTVLGLHPRSVEFDSPPRYHVWVATTERTWTRLLSETQPGRDRRGPPKSERKVHRKCS